MFPSEGGEYIYILTNPSFPGLVKIGRTDREVEERMRELSGHTGVPTEFELFQAFSVSDSVASERAIHVRLSDYRLSANREFFSIEPEIAAEIVAEYAISSTNPRANAEREDELLAEGTALAQRFGKVWPSLLGSYLAITFAEARQVLTLLQGRGIIDQFGISVRHGQRIVNLDVPPPAPDLAPASDRHYYPPLSALTSTRPLDALAEESLRRRAEQLLRTCFDCSLKVSLGEIHVGAAVTRYELVPEGLIRLEVLAEVQSRLAAALHTRAVRVYPMIQKGHVIGAEIPNEQARPFGLREVLESEDWVSARATVPIALGQLCGGHALILDLHKLPHLLVVGKEGSGRTELLNSVIGSILYSKSPGDVRVVLIDPTAREWNRWNVLPHLIVPVVNDPQLTLHLLNWLHHELEQRLLIFQAVNVADLVAFNLRPPGDAQVHRGLTIPSRMPHVVIVINEIADALLAGGQPGMAILERLIQKGGTVGLNFVLGTQRTSGDTLSQTVRDAIPARVCLRVASSFDSTNVLGSRGAENLLGNGDFLFCSPQAPRTLRAQAAITTETEVGAAMTESVMGNGPPLFALALWQSLMQAASRSPRSGREIDDGGDEGEPDFDQMESDEVLYRQALEVLASSRRASVDMLQRRLKIGINRAYRIMEVLESKGIVGPDNGSSIREILVDLDGL